MKNITQVVQLEPRLFMSMKESIQMKFICVSIYIYIYISRRAVVSREAKKKQYACASSGLRDHYSELFTRMEALKLKNAVTKRLEQISLRN